MINSHLNYSLLKFGSDSIQVWLRNSGSALVKSTYTLRPSFQLPYQFSLNGEIAQQLQTQ